MKAFADKMFTFAKKMISVIDRVGNLVGKEENAGITVVCLSIRQSVGKLNFETYHWP